MHSAAIRLLHSLGYPFDGLRSKSWEEFEGEGASVFHFIVTVCDNAAGEVCRIWRGKPMCSHWGIADPAAVEGADWEINWAFAEAHRLLGYRIRIFASLPFDKLDKLSLNREMDAIGHAGIG